MPYKDPVKRKQYHKQYQEEWYKKNKNRISSICKKCDKEFFSRNPQPYCSKKCSDDSKRHYQNCRVCGVLFYAPPSKKRIYCSRKCINLDPEFLKKRGKTTKKSWKNGVYDNIDWASYKTEETRKAAGVRIAAADRLRKGANHPSWKGGLNKKNGAIYNQSELDYEHRVIAKKILNRELESWECVHHLDKNRLNNKPSNLMVMSSSDHMSFHKKHGSNERVLAKYHPLSYYLST